MKGFQTNGKRSTFFTDLKEAHKLEDNFALKLISEFGGITEQPDKSISFPAYDVAYTLDDETFTFELKQDKKVQWSGNFAVETGRIINGVYKPTALSTTTADVWVYYALNSFFLIHSCDLKEIVKSCYQTKGGDGDRAVIALVPKAKFLAKAINLKDFINE